MHILKFCKGATLVINTDQLFELLDEINDTIYREIYPEMVRLQVELSNAESMPRIPVDAGEAQPAKPQYVLRLPGGMSLSVDAGQLMNLFRQVSEIMARDIRPAAESLKVDAWIEQRRAQAAQDWFGKSAKDGAQ